MYAANFSTFPDKFRIIFLLKSAQCTSYSLLSINHHTEYMKPCLVRFMSQPRIFYLQVDFFIFSFDQLQWSLVSRWRREMTTSHRLVYYITQSCILLNCVVENFRQMPRGLRKEKVCFPHFPTLCEPIPVTRVW